MHPSQEFACRICGRQDSMGCSSYHAILELLRGSPVGICRGQIEPALPLTKGMPMVVPRHGDLLIGISMNKREALYLSLRVGDVEVSRICLWGERSVLPINGGYPLPFVCFDYRTVTIVPLNDVTANVRLTFTYAMIQRDERFSMAMRSVSIPCDTDLYDRKEYQLIFCNAGMILSEKDDNMLKNAKPIPCLIDGESSAQDRARARLDVIRDELMEVALHPDRLCFTMDMDSSFWHNSIDV